MNYSLPTICIRYQEASHETDALPIWQRPTGFETARPRCLGLPLTRRRGTQSREPRNHRAILNRSTGHPGSGGTETPRKFGESERTRRQLWSAGGKTATRMAPKSMLSWQQCFSGLVTPPDCLRICHDDSTRSIATYLRVCLVVSSLATILVLAAALSLNGASRWSAATHILCARIE